MKKPLRRSVGPLTRFLARWASLLAGLALVIETSGCLTRGPVPLSISPQTVPNTAAAAEKGRKFRLVTFNIWGLPSWMTGAPHGRYPRIARALERLDADVILLQEAWTAGARHAAPANGRWSVARAAGQHTFFQQNGLVTLSKFPILGGAFYPFSRSALPDSLVKKGVLKVTVRLPGGEVLNVWNTHLQDGGSPEIRLSQIRELLARVETAEDNQIADLVGGDFNTTPDSPLCRELVEALGPSLQQRSGEEPLVTWDGLSTEPGAGRTYDYVFLRSRTSLPDLQTSQHLVFSSPRREERLSDHFGIEAVLDLTPDSSLAGTVTPLLDLPAAPSSQAVLAGGN